MPKSQIILSKYSPLMAVDCMMIGKDGEPAKMERVTSLCRCGESKNKPFCDGSHAGTGMTPQAFTAEEDGDAFLCQCKQTRTPPFCDGSHKGTGLMPEVFTAEATKTAYLCGCKHTGNAPFCDGSHGALD